MQMHARVRKVKPAAPVIGEQGPCPSSTPGDWGADAGDLPAPATLLTLARLAQAGVAVVTRGTPAKRKRPGLVESRGVPEATPWISWLIAASSRHKGPVDDSARVGVRVSSARHRGPGSCWTGALACLRIPT